MNARAETVAVKPAFRDAFAHRRCLVPVDGYYEWKQLPGGTQPYRITCNGSGGFALAGLWEMWEGADESLTSFTIITTEANDTVSSIHDRMLVVLPRDREKDWLSAGIEEAEGLLEPVPSEEVHTHPVSTSVNDPANDSPDVIEEVAAVEQSGLDEF